MKSIIISGNNFPSQNFLPFFDHQISKRIQLREFQIFNRFSISPLQQQHGLLLQILLRREDGEVELEVAALVVVQHLAQIPPQIEDDIERIVPDFAANERLEELEVGGNVLFHYLGPGMRLLELRDELGANFPPDALVECDGDEVYANGELVILDAKPVVFLATRGIEPELLEAVLAIEGGHDVLLLATVLDDLFVDGLQHFRVVLGVEIDETATELIVAGFFLLLKLLLLLLLWARRITISIRR